MVQYAKKVAEKAIEKRNKAQKKELKEKTKTLRDYLKELQVVFNKYIRLRDEGLPCISCNKPYDKNFHASHYFSLGHFPHLRFDELNVHGACVECNVHKHGNIAEYSINLPNRIGYEAYDKLLSKRKEKHKYTRNEVQDLIKLYKQKLKDLQK